MQDQVKISFGDVDLTKEFVSVDIPTGQAVEVIYAEVKVMDETEKGIWLKSESGDAWFPKSGFDLSYLEGVTGARAYELAMKPWIYSKMDDRQRKTINGSCIRVCGGKVWDNG